MRPIESDQGAAQAGEPDESVWSLAAFWVVAFAGAALLTAVLIAPRWEERQALALRVRAQSSLCAYLGDMNQHLGRVIDALKHDPDFTAEMARFELGYGDPDEQVIHAPVLSKSRPVPPPLEAPPDPWAPFVRLFARDKVVRYTAVLTAMVFVLVSLVCFNTGSDRPTRPRAKP